MSTPVEKSVTEMLDKPVEAFANKEVFTLDEETKCSEAAKLMQKKGVGSIIITRKGEAKGIVTERDMVYRLIAQGLPPDKTSLKQVMSSPLISVKKGTKVKEAIAIMAKHGFRRLIVKEDGKTLGVISQRTIVGDLKGELTPLAELELPTGVTCPYCGSLFPDPMALSKHIDRIHIGSGLLEGDLRKW
ncbi:MAG: CBS domain-containing protein [Thaumarchaeota archaeon]|nr:CBS domain-containing protein [Nitrososphaerota archaeon]